jgi:cellulose synthase (UDP-forming)
MLSIALLTLIDVPRFSPYEWYDLRRTVRLKFDAIEQPFWGFTTAISETGVEVSLTQNLPNIHNKFVQIELLEDGLVIQGQIRQIDSSSAIVQILFEPLNLAQQRQLIKLLYCRPGQWKSRCSPGELRSLWLLVKILLKPRFLDRQTATRSIAVAHH